MIGWIAYHVDGKMCNRVEGTRLMARVAPEAYQEALSKPGAKEGDFSARPMTGWGFVELDSLQRDKTLSAWVQMALNFDLQAKRLRKKK